MTKLKTNWLGKIFNDWTVISDVIYKKNKHSYIQCRCVCGSVKNVDICTLTSGASKSCGCSKNIFKKYDYLLNTKFGLWTIKKIVGLKHRQIQLLCLCDCGNIRNVSYSNLKKGSSKSCGCSSKNNFKKFEKYIGQKFGRWTIKKIIRIDKNAVIFEGICDCGKTKNVDYYSLSSKRSLSCGCLSSDLVRLRFSKKDSAKNKLLLSYRTNAKRRGLLFSLSSDSFFNLTTKNCFYCGSHPQQTIKSNSEEYTYNGIDRINNDSGYSLENCVPCCKICNKAKKDRTFNSFLKHIQALVAESNNNLNSYVQKESSSSYKKEFDPINSYIPIKKYYLRNAKNKKIEFQLTSNQFSGLVSGKCHYCGKKVEFPNNNGIDRVNNNLDYIFENCVSCCIDCNIAKSNLSLDNFHNWVDLLKKNINNIEKKVHF